MEVTVKAYAKVNFTLDCVSKRTDGYHEVRTIMQTVSLHDTITVAKADRIAVSCSDRDLPVDEHNSMYTMARRFFAHTGICGGARIHAQKVIPVGAGLGGGSSDAAATLRALDALYGTQLRYKDLLSLCRTSGADTGFFLRGGTQLAEGIGEILTPLPDVPPMHLMIVRPCFRMSTKQVYTRLDVSRIRRHPQTDAAVAAIRRGDVGALCGLMSNVLQAVSGRLRPEIFRIRRELLRYGATAALMSGSGSCVFGVFTDERGAAEAARHMPHTRNIRFICRTVQGYDTRITP